LLGKSELRAKWFFANILFIKLSIEIIDPIKVLVATTMDQEKSPYVFTFTSDVAGEYTFCFRAFETLNASIEYKSGAEARDYEAIAKLG
jgi:hypothetical protein